MNITCLEFHRRLTADPGDRDPAVARHSSVCPPCAVFAQRVARFDRSLRSAIDVDPPRELCARILLRQSCIARKATYTQRGWWLALAASVLAVVGLVSSQRAFQPDESLPQTVLAHVEKEKFALDTHAAVDIAHVNAIAHKLDTRVDDTFGTVSFASICEMGKSEGVHLVTRGNKGPITVLVMPNETVKTRTAIHDDHYQGVIVPRGTGSIAIVGKRGEPLDSVESRISASVHVL